eukprot:4921062-Prymnesium_polylepis.1
MSDANTVAVRRTPTSPQLVPTARPHPTRGRVVRYVVILGIFTCTARGATPTPAATANADGACMMDAATRFVYLVTTADGMPPAYGDYRRAHGARSTVIYLSFRVQRPGYPFLPNGSWAQNRNRLLAEALYWERRCRSNPQYYIFMDDHMSYMTVNRSRAVPYGVRLDVNPFRAFERFLDRWQPAMGVVRYLWHYSKCVVRCRTPMGDVACSLVNALHNTDSVFQAYHRDAARSVLLPYAQFLDVHSWYYSQQLINHLSTLFYNEQRLVFLPIYLHPKAPHASSSAIRGDRCGHEWDVMHK